jgi:hypothetical protein
LINASDRPSSEKSFGVMQYVRFWFIITDNRRGNERLFHPAIRGWQTSSSALARATGVQQGIAGPGMVFN